MPDLYQWLYDHYALPKLKYLESGQENILKQLSERLPLSRHQQRCLLDTGENLRLQWGTEAFALGIRFGLELAAPRSPDEDCAWLMNLLPQLDDPVS